jgi:acetoacetyl-CoA reductase/3-oxoacyl-[acyl-carrier protein] reductase
MVTGAARGIGRAIALQFAHRGAAVAINYRSSEAEAESLLDEITDLGAEGILVKGDVSTRVEAQRVVASVLDRFQRIDILVNNAGITRDHAVTKMTDEDWAEVLNVNLNGTYFCTSAVLPTMIQQKYGRIINVSSFSAQAGNFGQANYAASKGGIIAFTKVLALELARHNITANVIAPGFTCTDMLAKVPPEVLEQIKAKIPLRRFAQPDDIGKAAAFLAAEGDYITGQQLNINGGLYM